MENGIASRRAALRAGSTALLAVAGCIGEASDSSSGESDDAPVVDNGADDSDRNVSVLVTVEDADGNPVEDEPVILQDRGGTPDDRKGHTGSAGPLKFVENVGPPPCNTQRLVLPDRGRSEELGCHDGWESIERVIALQGE